MTCNLGTRVTGGPLIWACDRRFGGVWPLILVSVTIPVIIGVKGQLFCAGNFVCVTANAALEVSDVTAAASLFLESV